jgi:hypothetical protein
MNPIFATGLHVVSFIGKDRNRFMKKILFVVTLLLVLFILFTFLFIPGKIIISQSKVIGTTAGGFDTCLHNLKKWKQWWPGESSASNDSLFVYNKYNYQLSDIFTDGGAVQIGSNSFSLNTRIQTVGKDRDSITATWGIEIPTGNNPFTRFARYLSANGLKKNVQTVFDSLCHFADQTVNIYGFPIERTTFTEVILIAYRFKSTVYPTTDVIYDGVNKLRQYLVSQGATEKYYPMMNSKQVDSGQYETMIAISIDKKIPARNDFFLSQMVAMKDRFLATEVMGGKANIEKAHDAVEKYMSDHSLSSPAIPFEILVTDRSKETDTAKWKTRIIYPSM